MNTYRKHTFSLRRLLFGLLVAGLGFASAPTPVSAATTCPTSTPAGSPPAVLTSQYANTRQGYNGKETVLTAGALANGSVALCQPTWSPLAIDAGPSGQTNEIMAQPLYVPGTSVVSPANTANCNDGGSGKCNMLISATLSGSVFAWNADTGTTLWSDCQGAGCTNNPPWVADCGALGSVSTTWGLGGLSFAGIVSTPVIDNSGATPVMYTTSLCQTSEGGTAGVQWWLHEIDLTTGRDVCAGGTWTDGVCSGNELHTQILAPGGANPFQAWETLQRPALLEAPNPGTGGPSNLIYIAFGSGQGETNSPYNGWIFGYNGTPESLTQEFALNTAAASSTSNTARPSCSQNCYLCLPYDPKAPANCNSSTSCVPGSNPPCCCATSCVPKGNVEATNWCGQGGGTWMSGQGPAAQTLNGVSHAYFGVGNGAFQQYEANGATFLNPLQSFGESVVDLKLSGSAFDSSPSQYFTPYGGLPVEVTTGGAPYTFEGMNMNDFDMGICGVLLFNDAATNPATPFAVTCDKAGYGYLLKQGNLCGSPTSKCYPDVSAANGGKPGGAAGDPGDTFPFGLSTALCANQTFPDLCHRVTGLAFYPQASPQRLYFWPNQEILTSLQVSNNTPLSGSGTLSTGTSLTSVTLSVANQVVVGDQITGIAGQPTQTVTTVNSGSTDVTVSPGFTSAQSGVTGWQYKGYFVNPLQASEPKSGSTVQYPGGAVEVTSDNGGGGIVWAIAKVEIAKPCPPNCTGTVFAFDAATLQKLWCTNSETYCDNSAYFQPAPYARPTIVNGNVYVPTYGLISKAGNPNCTTSAPCSGVIVYLHTTPTE
jgi:hypothetical protein